jgi:GDPmannose 4,6-dehydratase
MQWLILQQQAPDDYVIATGEQHSVRQFITAAAREIGIDIVWRGAHKEEKGYDQKGRCLVEVDSRYYRPTEVESLLGDASKAREKLGWVPRTSFDELVREMVKGDLELAKRDALAKSHGFAAYGQDS